MAGFFCIAEGDGRAVCPEVVERMVVAGRHRGPDGVGVLQEGCRAFAQFDLLTRDSLSSKTQPLVTLGGDLVLVCDARLDEREELRSRMGIATADPTNAELILAAYRNWDLECPKHLTGDFAFVLWDRNRDRIFCARDCFGIKPLHYSWSGRTFCAASEARQLLQHPKVSRRLDDGALGRYLVNDESEESATIFRDVRRLPPGHTLTVEEGRLNLRPSHVLELPKEVRYRRDEEYSDHFLEVLREAVEGRLETSGPKIGIFMSGGLDSCSVAALAQERLGSSSSPSLLAGSFSFPSLWDCDESRWSRRLARDLGIDLRFVNAEDHWLLGEPGSLAPDIETPFQGWRGADRSILGMFREAGVNVALTGFGGDNMTQGSHHVFRSLLRRGRILESLRALSAHAEVVEMSTPRAALHYLVALSLPDTVRGGVLRALGRRDERRIPDWLSPDFARRAGLRGHVTTPKGRRVSKDPAVQVCFDLISVLDTVARSCFWLDRLGAEYGIELRHPFLDRRVADFVLSIPPEKLFDGRERKILLRRAMAGRLPDEIRKRRGKTRFGPYIHRSLRVEAATVVRKLLLDDSLLVEMGILQRPVVAEGLESYFSGDDVHGLREPLWFLVTLEIWLRSHHGRKAFLSKSDEPPIVPSDPALRQVRIAI